MPGYYDGKPPWMEMGVRDDGYPVLDPRSFRDVPKDVSTDVWTGLLKRENTPSWMKEAFTPPWEKEDAAREKAQAARNAAAKARDALRDQRYLERLKEQLREVR